MMKNYNLLKTVFFAVLGIVFSTSKLYGQINVAATAGTTTGTYTTLSAAFAAINAGTHQGVIDISVVANTTEPASATPLLASGGTSSYTAVTVKPSGGNWIINSAATPTANRGVIELQGADNVTIDGDDPLTAGARNLTVLAATSANTGVTCVRLSSNSTTGTDGATNITVKNLIIVGSRNGATSTVVNYGINMSNYSTTSMLTGAYNSTNTILENNQITRCYRGIYANGGSSTYPNNGLIIRNNILGTTVATDNIGLNAIYVSNTNTSGVANSVLIAGNDLQVGDVSPTGTGISASISGIELAASNSNARVFGNNIHDIIQPSTGLWGSYGVNISSATNNDNISINNNYITNILNCKATTTSFSSFTSYGIRVSVGATLINIIHNTIVVNASQTGTTANYTNYGIGISSTAATISKFYNNIIVNNNTGTGTFGFATSANANISGSACDNNDYYVPSGNVGLYNSINQTTLASWKAATNKDANSWNVLPNFVSATDYHLTTAVSLMESNGAPVATTGVSVDFDNQTRPGPAGSVNGGGTNPDIGADEYDGFVAPIPVLTFNSATPSLSSQCATASSRLISMNVTTPSGTITSVTLNYSFNGVAQTPITMTNTAGSTYEGTIPAGTPANAMVTWSVSATNSASVTMSYTGTAYQDVPLTGYTASVQASSLLVCQNAPATLTAVLTSPPSATYTTPSILNPTTDEDLGTVTIMQGSNTVFSNTTAGGSLVGTIGTATGTAGSYSDFTAFGPFNLIAGLTYNSTTKSITQGGNFSNSMAIFIDYNRNGSFADPGEMVVAPAATTSGPHTETGTFTVPMTALNGSTRMRVYCLETLITSSTSSASWGEYEDYMVNITNASVSWSDGVATIGTTNPITVNPAGNTTYTATISVAGCPITANTTISTLTLPSSPTATNSSQCGTGIPTASVASTAGASGTGQYYWYDAATNGNILQTPPLGAFTTFYQNDFTSTTIGAGASLTGVASLTAVPGQLQLTPNATSQQGGIMVAAGVNAQAYHIEFDVTTTPAGGADGFSYSFGDDVNTTTTSPAAEMGSGTKLKISFDSYGTMPNAAGIYVLYNSTATSFNATGPGVLGYNAFTSWVGSANNHVVIDINNLGQISLSINGTAVFTNVQLPAAYSTANKASWIHGIAARTGGISMQQLFDNLLIQSAGFGVGSTTYNSSINSTTTMYVSEVGTNGCYSTPTPVNINVLTPAGITSSISKSPACINDNLVLNASSSATPAYTFTWTAEPAAGSGIPTPVVGASTTATPTVAGTYSYIVNGTNGTCATADTITVVVTDLIPNTPVAAFPVLNLCTGATTGQIAAVTSTNVAGTLATTQAGGNGCTHGNMFNLTAGATNIIVNSIDVTPNTTSAQNVLVYYKVGTYIGSETNAGAWTLVGTYPINGTTGVPVNIDIADFTIPAGQLYGVFVDLSAQYSNIAVGTTYTNADLTLTVGAGVCTAFSTPNAGRAFNGTIHYTKSINATSTWFDAASGGNIVGTGSPFETVGSSLISNPATNGNSMFYVASTVGGCYSLVRDSVLVSVAPVNVALAPVHATCNGLDNGSFTSGTVFCGTSPFMYSVNGGAFSATIPTNLVAGTYTIVVQDAGMLTSGPIMVTIQEPSAPTNLSASNVTYYQGNLSWTAQGTETSWVVEYGPTGFTPGTGTIINASNDTLNVWGLDANTTYDFYVQAGCVSTSDWAGPFTFSTDPGFLAWDNQCPTMGFVDISGTGTDLNLTDDSETGITLPFSFPYQGNLITDLTVGNNGGIQLGTLTGAVGYGGNMTTIIGDYLFAWGDDLDDETGNVYYEVVGTSPNQVAIFQWNNQNNFSNGAGMVTFQIQMYENGEIYYVYDDVLFGGTETADDYAANADIGLSGPTTDINVSNNNAAYLQNNSCVHFYYALCPNVQNMVVLTYQEDAQLNWDPGLYGETNWTLVYGLEGFDPSIPGQAIDTLYLTSSDANFGGTLTQLTSYDVYIYSECQADSLTSSGFMVNFTTKPWCSDISGLAGQTDPDSLELIWNWIETSPVYPVTGFNIQYGMTGFQLGSGTITPANGIDFSDTIVDPTLMGSGVYQIYVQAECSGTNDTSNWVGPITVVMPVTNDIVCDQEALQLNTQYTFNTTNATVSLNEVNIAPPATGAQTTDGWVNSTLNGTLWYTFVAPPSGQVRINSTAINYNSQSAVYTATNCGDFNTFSLVNANDDAIEGGSSAPNYTVCGLTPGNTYYLMYDKFNATNGNFGVYISEVVLNAGLNNPVMNICSGDTVNLFTTINGYQTGGAWSAPVAAVNASITDSTFVSGGLAYQTFNFEYRVVDGCAFDTVVSQIHIYGPSNAGQDGTITACRNQPIDLLAGLNGNADLNGTWYDPSNAVLPNSNITTANFPGQYNYDYVSGNGVCPDDTANVVVTVTGCNFLGLDETIFEDVQIYPNPTTGVIFVQASFENGSFEAEVTDVNGRIIKQATITSQSNSINITGVERGTYFIKMTKDNLEKMFKIVVQ